MKREIKFRGKRVDNGEWVCGDLVRFADGMCAIVVTPFSKYGYTAVELSHLCPVESDTVSQFTGCYDYEDNEIFEGDLVTYPEYMGDEGYPTPSRYVYEDTPHKVVFKEGCFWLIPQYDEWQGAVNFSDMSMEYKPRVVGNIHDNPRFIKNSVWKKS